MPASSLIPSPHKDKWSSELEKAHLPWHSASNPAFPYGQGQHLNAQSHATETANINQSSM